MVAIDRYGAYKIGRYDGYLAGAEPREKRIAELEKENAELRYQLNKNPCVKTPEWHCSDCLKENVGLQEQNRKLLESCEGVTMMYEDLTKAKEIIRLLLHALKNEGSDYTFALKNTHPVLAEAEQFLKEKE